MAKNMKITGEKEIAKNLGKAIAGIEGDISKGLKAAGLFILAKAVPLTPKEFGNLRNSTYESTSIGLNGPKMTVGYTQEYAPHVHEMPMVNPGKPRSGDRKGTYWESGENKFLEKAVVRNVTAILNVIKKRAKR